VDVLFQGVDALQRICSPQADTPMSEPSIQALLDRITAIREGRSSPPLPSRERESPVSPVVVELGTNTARSREDRVTLPEVLDASASELLRVELSNTLRREPARIRLDFSRVRHLSAAALSLFASLARETTRAETATTVDAEGVSAEMAVFLRTTGLDRTIKWND
jgi:anti-anti-sigma regulatory factor